MQTEPPAVWTRIGTALDSAMAGLNPADQDAVVLRYFENRSLREVGVALGASEDAAQKRVCRALEKLRIALARTGHNVPGGALAAAIGWGAIQAAPVGLAASLTTAILTSSLASTASTAGLIRPDQFELLHHGPLSHVARPGDTILLRERQAWPAGPDSPRLARTYAFVDGHTEIRVEPDGDFSAWEAARTAPTQP